MNVRVCLARYPSGVPVAEDFHIAEEPRPVPAEGEVLIEVEYVSLNPAMRNWMKPGVATTMGTLELGDLVRAEAVGTVVESTSPDLVVGDAVFGMLGVQNWAVATPESLQRIDVSIGPISAYLGVFGLQGLAAFFGMGEVAEVQTGEVVLVSGAGGAVGSIAGQIAKQQGARVIGLSSSPAKLTRLVDELGFDAALDYSADDFDERLGRECPNGVNVFFDNTGGEVLNTALTHLAIGARVIVCGATSQYNGEGAMQGPSNYFQIALRRARMQGFLVMDYAERYEEGRRALAEMMQSGSLNAPDQILGHGIAAFPEAIGALFGGANFGKGLLQATEVSDS